MKRLLTIISLLATSTAAVAQERITVGDFLDLEERILMKKMNDELSKPNPNAPSAPPVLLAPRQPRIVYPTEALAVYGTSATSYVGQLSMGGKVYTVRTGTSVQDYVVTSIAPHGIELSKYNETKQRGKAPSQAPKKQTLFLPTVSR